MNTQMKTLATLAALLALSAVEALLPAAYAAVPQKFTYQGNLWEEGSPVNSGRPMIFKLTDATGASVYWSTGPLNVAVSRGHFAIELSPTGVPWGAVTPFIEVTVGGHV